MGSSGILGTAVGAILGGKIIKIGRRYTFMIATAIAFLGTCVSLLDSLAFLMIGRLIYGFGCGILSICAPRFLEETVPEKLLTFYQPVFMTSAAIGVLLSLVLGAALPPDDNPALLKVDGFWRLIIGAPLPLQILSMLSMAFYVKYDSVKYLINTGQFT